MVKKSIQNISFTSLKEQWEIVCPAASSENIFKPLPFNTSEHFDDISQLEIMLDIQDRG